MKRINFLLLTLCFFSYQCSHKVTGINLDLKNKGLDLTSSSNNFNEIDSTEVPKSVIFIVADGTGIGHYTTLYYGQNDFSFSKFLNIGLMSTHPDNNNQKVTDSAAAATAFATGQKTKNGYLSRDTDDREVKHLFEKANENNFKTGIVATSSISHATPAAFSSHVNDRNQYEKIAEQQSRSSVDIMLGGGKKDWRKIISNKDLYPHIQWLDSIKVPIDHSKERVVGLFSEEGMASAAAGRSPTTTEMAKKAIRYLSKEDERFFLMIEESQIDWASHSNDAGSIFKEMQSFNDLVNFCISYQQEHPDVLLVVTSDHETGGAAVHDGDKGHLDIRFTSFGHSANFVPIWSMGPGSKNFAKMIDNSQVGKVFDYFVATKPQISSAKHKKS